MKHRKSSQRQVAKRREGKHAPRAVTLPPTISADCARNHVTIARNTTQTYAEQYLPSYIVGELPSSNADYLAQIISGMAQSPHMLPRTMQKDYRPFADCAIRTTCMMEREKWA